MFPPKWSAEMFCRLLISMHSLRTRSDTLDQVARTWQPEGESCRVLGGRKGHQALREMSLAIKRAPPTPLHSERTF